MCYLISNLKVDVAVFPEALAKQRSSPLLIRCRAKPPSSDIQNTPEGIVQVSVVSMLDSAAISMPLRFSTDGIGGFWAGWHI